VDDPRERQIQQIVENAHREDLKPSEVLASVQKLVAMGMKPLEIAERLNRDQSTISHYLSVGAHQDLVEQVDKLGITKATIKAGERSRAAGSTRGRKPRVDKAENSTAWGNTTREDHFTEQPSSTRANQSQALVVVEPERQAAYDNAPSMTGLTLVVAHRATTAEEWVHSLEAWLTALSTPAGQAWIPALPDTLRNEVAGKLATLLRLVDPVTVSDTE